MRVLAVLAAVLGSTACVVPIHRGLSMERTRLWAPPDAPAATTGFSWKSRIEHRETSVLSPEKEDIAWKRETSDEPTRAVISAVDLATGSETRLGDVRSDGEPYYYDARRRVLWVKDMTDENPLLSRPQLRGLAGAGSTPGPANGALLVSDQPLPPPFVFGEAARERSWRHHDLTGVVLYDLAADGAITLPPEILKAQTSVDGSVVRFMLLGPAPFAIHFRQIAIDWSSGQPNRLADLEWTTPPLSPADGTRLAYAVRRDGRRYAEAVRGPTGTRLLVYDLAAGGPPVMFPLPEPEQPPSGDATQAYSAHVVFVGDDAIVFSETLGAAGCWRGATVRLDSGRVAALGDEPCVKRFVDAYRLLGLDDDALAQIDTSGAVVALGRTVSAMNDALRTGPTTRVIQTSAALEQVNLATGATTTIGKPVPGGKLLAVNGGDAVYSRGNDTFVKASLAGGSPVTVELPAPVMTGADRMPLDRNEFWIGLFGGGSTNGRGVGGLDLELAHWLDGHWTAVGRAVARIEDGPSKSGFADVGGTFGAAWHGLPRLSSLLLEADLGAFWAETIEDGKNAGAHFAPSAEVHVGMQGKFLALDASAVLPSFIDFDRGVQLLLTFKFGFTENLQ